MRSRVPDFGRIAGAPELGRAQLNGLASGGGYERPVGTFATNSIGRSDCRVLALVHG